MTEVCPICGKPATEIIIIQTYDDTADMTHPCAVSRYARCPLGHKWNAGPAYYVQTTANDTQGDWL